MASPNTIKAKLGAEMRAEATRKAVVERYAETHPSLPKTSTRWMNRTKGLPYSRMMLKEVVPAIHGSPALLVLKHPTRKTGAVKAATPGLLRVFFPSIPENLAAAMLGH